MTTLSSVFVQKLRSGLTLAAALALIISPLGAGFSTLVAHAADPIFPDAPVNVSPADGSTLTTAAWDKADWSDVTPQTGGDTVTYVYESSNDSTANPDGSFVTPVYTSGALSSSEQATTGTPDGSYYWHAMAVENGTNGSWSTPVHVTVDNSAPPIDHSNVYVSISGDDSHDGTLANPLKTIAAAIALVDAEGTVHVDAGTYDEQLSITKNVTLVGNGVGSTLIEAPSTLSSEGAIVNVDGSGVTADISGLTVTGPGPAACGSLMSGIFVSGGAHASIHDLSVTHVRDSALSGCQNGRGILVGWGHGSTITNTTGSATIRNVTVSDYQKAGIEVSGSGSSATIDDNQVTGAGSTGLIAQNGIEVSYGASANIAGNTVSGNSYTGANSAAGILLYNPADSTVVGANSVSSNQMGLWTNGQGSVGSLNISGVSGNTRDAVADSTGWTAPTAAYVDASWTTKVADSDGGDLVTSNGTTAVYGYDAFDTIKKGITAVGDSSTVNVASGTYNEDITVTHNDLSIVGAGSGSTIVNSDGSNGYGIYDYQHSGFSLSGMSFNVAPTDAAIRYAFAASYADGVTLNHVIFNGAHYNAGGTAYSNTIGGVDANTSSNISYASVTSTGFYKNGFSFTPAYASTDPAGDGITLNNVTSTNNGWAGIAFYTVGHDKSTDSIPSIGGSNSFSDVHLTGTNTISGNEEGVFVEGDSDANHVANSTTVAPVNTVTSDGTTLDLTHVDFSSNTLYDIENYQTAPVNAIGATFAGKLGNAMNASERASEDVLIKDVLDNATLGMVSYHIPDTIAPVITLNGDASVTIEHASGYSDAGATAIDDVDGSVAVTTTGDSIDTNTDGTYTVTYTATDSSGNTATSTRAVTVVTTNRGGGGGRSGGSTGGSTSSGTGTTGTVTTTDNGGGQVLGASTYNFTANLTIGSTGADVTALQDMLIAAGFLHITAPTGYFGPLTRAALAAWQSAHGISPAVGYFGPISRAEVARLGLTGTPVLTNAQRAAILAQLADILKQVLAIQAQLAAMNK